MTKANGYERAAVESALNLLEGRKDVLVDNPDLFARLTEIEYEVSEKITGRMAEQFRQLKVGFLNE